MFSVYVLRSRKDLKLYIGFTENVRERLKRHGDGDVPSTRERRPLDLIFLETYLEKGDALRREQYFKTSAGKKTLKLMLRDYFQHDAPSVA